MHIFWYVCMQAWMFAAHEQPSILISVHGEKAWSSETQQYKLVAFSGPDVLENN